MMMNKTPVRENTKTVRRKLDPSKDTKARSVLPITKRPKVINGTTQIQSIAETHVPDLSKVAPDIDDLLSQEISSHLSNDLPRVSWQSQNVTSPLLSADTELSRDYGGIIASVKVDTKEADATSTPYLTRIWKRKARSNAEQAGSASVGDSSNSPAWIDKMYSMVSQLEDQSSRSPTPDISTTLPASSQSYTSILPKAATTTPERGRGSTTLISAVRPTNKPASQPYVKPEPNSSLFSDSLDGFTTDFTLSDTELEDDVPSDAAVNKSAHGAISPAAAACKNSSLLISKITTSTLTASQTDSKLDQSDKSVVKTEPTLPIIKQEPKTPPSTRAATRRHRESPGTPLRRYRSHDSAISSPKPALTLPATSTQSTAKLTLDYIEEKRQLALSKLKNRKGSLVRHKSLDSAMIASVPHNTQPISSQLPPRATRTADERESKSLEQLIEEKRKLAAEKLQKHREEGRDRSNSLSGSLRQLTPPSSQDRAGVYKECASQASSSCSPAQSNKENNEKALSQSTLFSGKIALDILIEDLERESPQKTRPTPLSSSISVSKEKPSSPNKQSKSNSKEQSVQQAFSAADKGSSGIVKLQSHTGNVQLQSQSEQTIDDKTRQLIEQKRKTALEKRKQSRQQSGL